MGEDDGRCPNCGEDEVDGARCYYCGWHDYDCGLCDDCLSTTTKPRSAE